MSADNIRSRSNHGFRLLLAAHKSQGEEIQLVGNSDGFHLIVEPQSFFLQRFPKNSVNQRDRREVDDAGKSGILNLLDVVPEFDGGIRTVQPEEHRGVWEKGQQFPRSKGFHQSIAVSVAQVAGERRPPGRPEAAGAEGQHHVGPAGNGRQRGVSAAGRRTDYVPVGPEMVVQMSNNVFTIVQHGILSIVLSVVLILLDRPKCLGRIPPGCIPRSHEFAAAGRDRLPGVPFRIRW